MLTLGIINTLNSVYTEVSDEEKAKAEAAAKAEATKLAEAEATKAEAEAAELAKREDDEKVPIADLRKIRAEAANYRKQLRALEAERDASTKAQEKAASEAEIAKLEEVDQHKARAAQAAKELADAQGVIAAKDARLTTQTIETAVFTAANAAGFANPEDASPLLERELSGIELTDGEVNKDEINDLVKQLAESKSYLLKGETSNEFGGGPSNPPNPKGPKVKFTGDADIAQLKQQAAEGAAKGNMPSAISLYNQAWEKEHGVKPPGG